VAATGVGVPGPSTQRQVSAAWCCCQARWLALAARVCSA